VRAWEEAYLLEPSNLRAREFLRSALERIHAHMGAPPATAQGRPQQEQQPPVPAQGPAGAQATGAPRAPSAAPHPWLPPTRAVNPPRQKLASPWDDGPSLALAQEPEIPVQPGDENSGAWGIHQEPLPVPPDDLDEEIAVLLRGARELVALNDFSGALDLTAKILTHKPGDAEVEQMHALCEENLTQMFESKLGAMTRKPRVAIKPDEVIWLNLDPRAGFVLAQIDGECSFEDLYAICGLSRLDTARILSQLLEEGVVVIKDDLPKAPARKAR
jgi:hypothetical protein